MTDRLEDASSGDVVTSVTDAMQVIHHGLDFRQRPEDLTLKMVQRVNDILVGLGDNLKSYGVGSRFSLPLDLRDFGNVDPAALLAVARDADAVLTQRFQSNPHALHALEGMMSTLNGDLLRKMDAVNVVASETRSDVCEVA